MSNPVDEFKRQAAEKAVQQVEDGMVVGLGSGSTAVYAVRAIGRLLAEGKLSDVVGVPTSQRTAHEAEEAGVPLVTLDEEPYVDLTIDGADEIDPELCLIKGMGGALLREKIVAAASERMIVVGDYRKRVAKLGTNTPVPVEVIPFARRPVMEYLELLGARVELRMNGKRPFRSDEGNFILDCYFDLIEDPAQLGQTMRQQPGVVEHGLFLNLATAAVVAGPEGIQVLHRS